jgi:hypothetical protein
MLAWGEFVLSVLAAAIKQLDYSLNTLILQGKLAEFVVSFRAGWSKHPLHISLFGSKAQ